MTNQNTRLFNIPSFFFFSKKLLDPKSVFAGWLVFLFAATATSEYVAHQRCSSSQCRVIHIGPFPDWYLLWVPLAWLGFWIKGWQGKTIITLALSLEFYSFFFTRQFRYLVCIYVGEADTSFSIKSLFDLQFLAACCLITFILCSLSKKKTLRKGKVKDDSIHPTNAFTRTGTARLIDVKES